MKKYIYKIEELDKRFDGSGQVAYLSDWLNMRGLQGWHLSQIDSHMTHWIIYYAKLLNPSPPDNEEE
jgi:hypothetical protein